MPSFWGEPTFKPRAPDVARFAGMIRELTSKQTPQRALQTITSTLKAQIAYVVEKHGPREALALLDTLRAEIAGNG